MENYSYYIYKIWPVENEFSSDLFMSYTGIIRGKQYANILCASVFIKYIEWYFLVIIIHHNEESHIYIHRRSSIWYSRYIYKFTVSLFTFWPASMYPQACSAEKLDKNGYLLGFVQHTYFVFLNPLQIFVPRLEIIFFTNHYFLVCIFKYCKNSCVNDVV